MGSLKTSRLPGAVRLIYKPSGLGSPTELARSARARARVFTTPAAHELHFRQLSERADESLDPFATPIYSWLEDERLPQIKVWEIKLNEMDNSLTLIAHNHNFPETNVKRVWQS